MDLRTAGCTLCIIGLGGWVPIAGAADGETSKSVDAQASKSVEELLIVAPRDGDFDRAQFDSDRLAHQYADVAKLGNALPGGGAADNGPLSGQLQYRGLFGPRMNVRVGGRPIESGGPNWMDPPLHYMPAGLLDQLNLERGIAPVSSGRGLGGAADAHYKRPAFAEGQGWQIGGDIEAGYRSIDSSHSLGGVIGLVSDSQRLYGSFSQDEGDDYDFGSGTVDATEFERKSWGLAYEIRTGAHELAVDYRRLETDHSGTPSLPLDIDFLDTDLWNARYAFAGNRVDFEIRAFGSDIDHGMDNFRLRPAPDFSMLPLPPFLGPDRRQVDASGDAWGVEATASFDLAGGRLSVGADVGSSDHDAAVTDPDFAPFFVDNFNDAETDRLGGFVEWTGEVADAWQVEAGARVDRVEHDAGPVDAFPAQLVDMNPAMWPPGTPPRAVWLLRERFNSASRDVDETLWDWVVETRYSVSEALTAEFGVARKSRAPSYLERFLWIPLEINSGLGDGNAYVGDIDLDPEVSHQIELGLDWQGQRGYASPRAYYRRVDDYIQGTPSTDPVVIAVSANASGDPTPLAFTNVDAELWGVDLAAGWRLTDVLRVDAVASFVRGSRRDTNDDLYRIAPPRLRLSLTWQRDSLSATLEQAFVAEQDKLSQTLTDDPGNPNNSFEKTSSYGLTNLYGRWRPAESFSIDLGIGNLWDNSYVDHLTGFNRVSGSDVDVGRRLPGHGRNGFARLRYRW